MSIIFNKRRFPFGQLPTLVCLIGIFALSISACFSRTTQANAVPAACLSDSGEGIEPLLYSGAWAIILNFNHDPSATHTEACWAIRGDDAEMAVTYTDGIRCQVRNNSEGVLVGDGSATFDGNFHITCPRRELVPDPNVAYDTFYVHAEATFDQVDAVYPLVRHNNIAVRARFEQASPNGPWTRTLRSRYGVTEFEDSQQVPMIPQAKQHFNSVVHDRVGSHYINRQLVNSQVAVEPFEFDYTELIFIGGGNTPWELHEIVIDPPGSCNGCFN